MQYILIQVTNNITQHKEKLDYNLYNAHGEIIYKSGQKISDNLASILEFTPTYKKDTIESESGGNEVKLFVDKFLREMLILAVKKNVKKVLIEPNARNINITFEINDYAKESTVIDKKYLLYLTKKMKNFANIEEKEGYSSHIGSIGISLFNKTASYKFATSPSPLGDVISLEVIEAQKKLVPSLLNLSFSQTNYDELLESLKAKTGIFIISGPNYSGKTMTFVSVLKQLKKSGKNILLFNNNTSEYKLSTIKQIPKENISDVNFNEYENIDVFGFDDVNDFLELKQIIDIIPENKLIIATSNSHNVIDTLKKLVKAEQKDFKIINALIGVLAQKLVKKVCQNCKTKIKLTDEQIKNIFEWDGKASVNFYKGKGCDNCEKTGFDGTIPVYEMLGVNDNLKELLISLSSFEQVKDSPFMNFKKMRYDGVKKALCGLITLDEVERI